MGNMAPVEQFCLDGGHTQPSPWWAALPRGGRLEWAACHRCPGGERGELDGAGNGPRGRRRTDRNDGHTVDALALDADEGRGHATKCSGEALAAGEPEISEWGNPPGVMAGDPRTGEGTGGTETSQYPEEKRGCPQ